MCLENNSSLRGDIKVLNDSIYHRGPDEDGVYISPKENVGLGHRRLSILDLSEGGAQPMLSQSGDLAIVFNGEIYNYLDIKKLLLSEARDMEFRGTSDTEVLLNAIEFWGIEKAMSKCSGMFAFALWSNSAKTLTLCRDRFGEKPLYYYKVEDRIVFASELSGIEALFRGNLELDDEAIAAFFKYTYVPGDKCIYKGIKKLRPGSFIVFSARDLGEIDNREYWSSEGKFLHSSRNSFRGDYSEAKRLVNDKFETAVGNMMNADVDVGAFLSGGVDSAAVVSKMYRLSGSKIQTFSMGFGDSKYDELADARKIASHFKTDHHDFRISEPDIFDIVSSLSSIYDEPFADSSQLPTVLISRFASRKVKVALTGDGGDEFFGGYPRHSQFAAGYRKTHYLPRDLRRILGHGLELGLKSVSSASSLRPSLSGKIRQIEKLKSLLLYDLNGYWDWVTHWRPSDSLVITKEKNHFPVNVDMGHLLLSSGIDKALMYLDSQTYLINEILVKVDRGAMTNSLETRAPFLDHDLVEFSWSLPSEMLNKGGVRKFMLREIVENEIQPLELKKQKTGFAIPLGTWLRNGLKPWALEILEYKPAAGSILNESIIKSVWDQHQSGQKDNSPLIWSVLMFKSWCKKRNI